MIPSFWCGRRWYTRWGSITTSTIGKQFLLNVHWWLLSGRDITRESLEKDESLTINVLQFHSVSDIILLYLLIAFNYLLSFVAKKKLKFSNTDTKQEQKIKNNLMPYWCKISGREFQRAPQSSYAPKYFKTNEIHYCLAKNSVSHNI